ncbi:MAG: PilZ domain-containing protein [Caulobacteraceae bacterium]
MSNLIARTASPDRRAQAAGPRKRALLSGVIVHGGDHRTLECAIRDVSLNGARIKLVGPVPVGAPLHLVDLSHGKAYAAKLAWRRGVIAGLEFEAAYDLSDPACGAPLPVRSVWLAHTRAPGSF